MASMLMASIRSKWSGDPPIRRMNEKAGQTFLAGVPVMLDTATGGVQEWDGTTITAIGGISKEGASNLTTTGVAKNLTFGTVQNQANAVNIPAGAPINDGRIGFELADDGVTFIGQVGPAQTTAATDPGKQYGMTKDSDGHWYVDKTKTTAGTNTVVQVVKLDPNDVLRGVHFVFLRAAQQILS